MARFRISRYPLRRRRRLSGSRIRLLKFSAILLSVITTRYTCKNPQLIDTQRAKGAAETRAAVAERELEIMRSLAETKNAWWRFWD